MFYRVFCLIFAFRAGSGQHCNVLVGEEGTECFVFLWFVACVLSVMFLFVFFNFILLNHTSYHNMYQEK